MSRLERVRDLDRAGVAAPSLIKPSASRDAGELKAARNTTEAEELLGILNRRAERVHDRAARLRDRLVGLLNHSPVNEIAPPRPSMEAPFLEACVDGTQGVEDAIQILDEILDRLAL